MLGPAGWQWPKAETGQDLVLIFKGTVELILMVSGCRKEGFKLTPPHRPSLHPCMGAVKSLHAEG